MNITVLTGGTSTERDVSIVTATNVCKALRECGHRANVIDVFFGTDKYETSESFFVAENDLQKDREDLFKKTKDVEREKTKRNERGEAFFGQKVFELAKAADVVFMGLHGENGENGKIQAAFDLLGIKYTGPGSLSSAIAMDKDLTKKILKPEGIRVPGGITLYRESYTGDEKKTFPCVVKPACGGSSIGVSIVYTEDEYDAAIREAFKLEDKIIVEEYIKGREFSVGVMNGKALPVIEIIVNGATYDYEHKYDPNGAKEVCPAEIPDDVSCNMKNIAEDVCRVLGIKSVSRIDQLLSEDGEIVVLEVNTLPGMTPTSLLPQEAAANGISYGGLCEEIIKASLKERESEVKHG